MAQIIGQERNCSHYKECKKRTCKINKAEKRVKKLLHIEDPERIQVTGREREKQQRLPELKSQKRAMNFIYIQDPENMQHIDLKRSQRQQMIQPNIGEKKYQPRKEYSLIYKEYSTYGYDHQADNHYVNKYDHADYQYNRNEHNHRAGDQYGGCGSVQGDNEGCGVIRRIGSNERHHFYGNDNYIYSKYFSGNHQNNTDTQQPKQNQFIGRGGVNGYNAGVTHCD